MKKIIKIVLVLAVIGGAVWFFTNRSTEQQVSKLDATDTVLGFYDQWMNALKNPTSADPSKDTLSKSPILSPELRAKIATALKDSKATVDPVLCQAKVPDAISKRNVYVHDDAVQFLITSKDKKVTNQAIVDLKKYKDGWYISNINCAAGEFAPEREFSFENEGTLVKASVPKPYDPKKWHLVFEEDGEAGHIAPLFFDKDSQCTTDGKTSVCKPDEFTEKSKVFVQAEMTEMGATVKKMQFVK